jgi:hypothetical protein
MNYSGEILNFFEILQEYLEEHTTNYKEIYDTRILYENSENDEQRKNYLMLLIKRYLLIKDFQSAFSYIEKYIELGFDADGNYAELQGELTGLLDDIKKKIARRTTKDVIVYWMDAVPYAHMDMFPNISKAAQDGISFENAYTVNPWTTETLKCIMYGQKSIEDRLFLKKDFQMGDTLLLDYLNRGDCPKTRRSTNILNRV